MKKFQILNFHLMGRYVLVVGILALGLSSKAQEAGSLAPLEVKLNQQESGQERVVRAMNVDFGTRFINSINQRLVRIDNTGKSTLNVTAITHWGFAYEAFSQCGNLLAPGKSCNLIFRFWPEQQGFHRGRAFISFGKTDFIFELYGWGQ